MITALYDAEKGPPSLLMEIVKLPTVSEDELEKQWATIKTAKGSTPPAAKSVTKRDADCVATDQYHGRYRVSKACQNHMPVKEYVFEERRIDEDDFPLIASTHGVEALSSIVVLHLFFMRAFNVHICLLATCFFVHLFGFLTS